MLQKQNKSLFQNSIFPIFLIQTDKRIENIFSSATLMKIYSILNFEGINMMGIIYKSSLIKVRENN